MDRERAGTTTRWGVSLLEFLMVLVIMGIAGAMAVPRYAGFIARSRLTAAVTRVQADLENARQKAKHTGASQSVAFDPATSSYTISASGGPAQQTVRLLEDPYHAQISSVAFGAGTTVTFDGYGEPDSAGTVIIQVGVYSQDVTVDSSASHLIKLAPSIKVN